MTQSHKRGIAKAIRDAVETYDWFVSTLMALKSMNCTYLKYPFRGTLLSSAHGSTFLYLRHSCEGRSSRVEKPNYVQKAEEGLGPFEKSFHR